MVARNGAQGSRLDGFVGPEGDWEKLRPRTRVDEVIDAIIAAAARGAILPGDRIVETDMAQKLGVSRVPVREALRLLESQGLVVNEPYKGIRLRPVTAQRVDDLVDARVALESTATTRAIALGRNDAVSVAGLDRAVDEMELMATRNDAYGLAMADTAFHRALCALGGNEVVSDLWDTLARQLIIIVGLSTLGKPMAAIVDEHRTLVRVFAGGDAAATTRALDEHIRVQNRALDYEALVAERRAARQVAASA